MKKRFPILTVVVSTLLLACSNADARPVTGDYARLPLQFEANVGQTDERVKFLARGAGSSVFLSAEEAVLVIDEGPSEPTVLRMRLVGALEGVADGVGRLPGRSNYLFGNDPGAWHTGIPHFSRAVFNRVYPGIDLVYHGHEGQLEYDFVVAPGADPEMIRLEFDGARRIEIDDAGELVLRTDRGPVRWRKPVVFQEADGRRSEIPADYRFLPDRRVGFRLGAYDEKRRLVIDPVLSYSTYFGGTGGDGVGAVAVDDAGCIYFTGQTQSIDYPTGQPADDTLGGFADVFVTKLSKDGDSVVYSTFLGGSDEDKARGIAVHDGRAYVAGETYSTDYPEVNGIAGFRGGLEAFVTALDEDGSSLVFSTYLSGSGLDAAYAVAVDSAGAAYVAGSTASTNFYAAYGAQTSAGGAVDGFVTKVGATGDLVYSTYLGGSNVDGAIGVDVDDAGNVYATGSTRSEDFPTVDPLQATLAGGDDAFVTKIGPSGGTIVYSTYFGGTAGELAHDLAVDPTGIYLAGITESHDLPTASAPQSTLRGGVDAFVAKIGATGDTLVYSTYLGGLDVPVGMYEEDRATGIDLDPNGNAYVTGTTSTTDFPVQDATQGSLGGQHDGFVTQLGAAGDQILFSTYIGGSDLDMTGGIAVDDSGNIYVGGSTLSTDFPGLNAAQGANAGGSDGWVAKLGSTTPQPVPNGLFGVPMTARRTGDAIRLRWDTTTCSSLGYHVLYGELGGMGGTVPDGSVCNLGASGAFNWTDPPSGDLWFIVVGNNLQGTEGAWGTGGPSPRGGGSASGACGNFQRENAGGCGF